MSEHMAQSLVSQRDSAAVYLSDILALSPKGKLVKMGLVAASLCDATHSIHIRKIKRKRMSSPNH